MNQSVKKYLLILAGSLSLAAGIVGIVVPVLPTTPFLLLSSFCFLRSSQRLHDWLTGNKLFGEYIQNYLKYRAVKRRTKIISLIFLWGSLTLSIVLVHNLYIDLLLVFVGLAVSTHILY
jgi:Uncharacterized protein conserved in bacteria